MNNKKKTSISQKVLISAFIILFFGLSLAFIILPDKTFSENENRALSSFPEFSFKALFFEGYTSEISDYCSDQFPFRDTFINIKSLGELALLKGESGGIVLGKDGNLISDIGVADEKLIKENLSHIDAFSKKTDAQVYTAFVPTSSYVLSSYLPKSYPVAQINKFYTILGNNLPENVSNIDLYPTLSEHSSEYIYYKTDHHLTSLGAYYVYCELITSLGGTPYALSEFTREVASTEFYGTTWSFAGIPFISPDDLELFRFKGDSDYTVTINGKKTQTGLYDLSALDTKDKYSAFVTSTVNGKIEITSPSNTETILLIKDSFSHAVAPFLARHYNIVMIDTRYHTILKNSLTSLIEEENISKVIFLMGAQGVFDTSGKLYTLRNN